MDSGVCVDLGSKVGQHIAGLLPVTRTTRAQLLVVGQLLHTFRELRLKDPDVLAELDGICGRDF